MNNVSYYPDYLSYPQLNFLQIVLYERNKSYTHDMRKIPYWFSTIYMQIKGTAKFETPDESFEIGPGDLVFIPSNVPHISYRQGNPEFIYLCIHFSFLNRYTDFLPQNFTLQKIKNCQNVKTLDKMNNMYEKYHGKGMNSLDAMIDFFSLYRDLIPSLVLSKRSHFIKDNRIQPAIEFIEIQSTNDFDIKNLARMCNLSESRFHYLFRQTFGYSPMTYKNVVRIRQAMSLLSGPGSIEEISAKLGFFSSSYFRRVFKKLTGENPHEYRKNITRL